VLCALHSLQGMQLFGFKFSTCSLPGSQQLCPPGTHPAQCPVYPDCYIPCKDSEVFTWIKALGGRQAVCACRGLSLQHISVHEYKAFKLGIESLSDLTVQALL